MATGNACVVIGPNCDIGPHCMIITGTHEVDLFGCHIAGAAKAFTVQIGGGTWLGARCLILPGVRLKKRTSVAAGSVVMRSNDSENELLAGNPAFSKKIYS